MDDIYRIRNECRYPRDVAKVPVWTRSLRGKQQSMIVSAPPLNRIVAGSGVPAGPAAEIGNIWSAGNTQTTPRPPRKLVSVWQSGATFAAAPTSFVSP